MTTAECKTALRSALRERRRAIAPEARAHASRQAGLRLLQAVTLTPDDRVSLFWSLGSEIDTSPLRLALHHLGVAVLLPRTSQRAMPLAFHLWTPELRLQRSAFGVAEPPAEAPRLEPSLLVVPLLGFDAALYRLGYGAGHYDCTLADLAARGLAFRTAGLAFACQRVEEVPREAHDVPLDLVVTDEAVWRRRD